MDLQHRSLNLIGTIDDHGKPRPSSRNEKEHMFEKVVTPSDVGKLNRLVIPKQYAEKYLPFDSSVDEKKGLLLNFEDREGKPWRFRYSYWISSQSYVFTKGWSRFVKDNNLHAGDVVSFHRDTSWAGLTSRDGRRRLFIDCHRRPPSSSAPRARALGSSPVVFRSAPLVQAAAKRLRLFGVNMDCPMTESDDQNLSSVSESKLPNIGASSPHQQYDDPGS